MNKVLTLLHLSRGSPDPHPTLHSKRMLTELLCLHHEMIEQLQLERLGSVGSAEFLTSLIDQHEKTAAMLRAKLASIQPEADTNRDGWLPHLERPERMRLRSASRVARSAPALRYRSAS